MKNLNLILGLFLSSLSALADGKLIETGVGIESAFEYQPRYIAVFQYSGLREENKIGEMNFQALAFSAETGFHASGELSLVKLEFTPFEFTSNNRPGEIAYGYSVGKTIYEKDLDLGMDGTIHVQVFDLSFGGGAVRFNLGPDAYGGGTFNGSSPMSGVTGHLGADVRLPVEVMKGLIMEPEFLVKFSGVGGFKNENGARTDIQTQLHAILDDAEFTFSYGYTNLSKTDRVKYSLRLEAKVRM